MSPSRKRNCRGQALVEFAFVAVGLIALTFGVVEIGRMVLCYTTIANAARIGTRYAIVHGSDNPASISQIQDVVKGFLKAGTVNTATVSTCNPGTSLDICVTYPSAGTCKDPGCQVKVTVNYPYDPIMTYYSLGSINLASTSEGVITW